MNRTRAAMLTIGLAACAACARAPSVPDLRIGFAPPPLDSATVALWHMDEPAGPRVADAGPWRLDGAAGRDARTDYGRYDGARVFEESRQSFVLVPYDERLETGPAITIEAWVFPSAYGYAEGGPVACRWDEQPNEKSWLLTIAGRKIYVGQSVTPSPGYLADLVAFAPVGHLVFVFQPADAGTPRTYVSTRPIELDRWTHVAATYDGEIVRLFVDGVVDAQFEQYDRIRPSAAPLQIGNYVDPRLVEHSSDVPQVVGGDPNPYYAFLGVIDEVRLSNVARDDFPYVTGR